MLAGASTVTVRRDTRAKSLLLLWLTPAPAWDSWTPWTAPAKRVRWTGPDTKLRASPPVAALDEVTGALQSARSDVARLRHLTEAATPDQQRAGSLGPNPPHPLTAAAAEPGPPALPGFSRRCRCRR